VGSGFSRAAEKELVQSLNPGKKGSGKILTLESVRAFEGVLSKGAGMVIRQKGGLFQPARNDA